MNFDRVIIGSSPVCLLEAIYSNSIGIRTCVIDNAENIGGAWKPINLINGNISGVELGCHIIEKDKEVFDFFKNKLRLELVEIKPSPKIILYNKTVAYNLKNFFFIFRNIKYYITDKSRGKLIIDNIGRFIREIAQLNLKYYNFSRGSLDLVERLILELDQQKIPVLLKTNINSILVDKGKKTVDLITKKGETIKTSNLVISNNSFFNEILIDGTNRTNILQNRKSEFNHLHLLIKDKQMKTFSYWRIFNNKIIHRVSDMSHQINLNDDEHLICIGIFPDFMKSKPDSLIIENIVAILKKMKLVSSSCKILKAQLNSYHGIYTKLPDLKVIEQETNNLVEVLDTQDITFSIKANLKKYNAVQYAIK